MPNQFDLSSDNVQEAFRSHSNSYWELHIPDPRLNAGNSRNWYGVVPQELQSSSNPFMVHLPSGLEVPLPDAWNISDDRQWADINVAVTFSDLEEWASSDILAQASWTFLKRWVSEDLIKLCARLACLTELNYSNMEFWQMIVQEMYLPDDLNLKPRVCANLEQNNPLFNHHCVRMVMQHLAMLYYFNEDHTETGSRCDQSELDAASGISQLLFPESDEANMLTIAQQILTALWILHDRYYDEKTFTATKSTETALEALHEERYIISSPVRWLERLRTYWGMWSIPDDHPSVIGKVVPSTMRQEFYDVIGEYPVKLIQNLCAQLSNALDPTEPKWDVDDDLLQMLYKHTNQDVISFSRESTEAASEGDTYLACIKWPFLVFADGEPILHSTEFLVSQTCDLYWSHVANFDSDKLGPLFEAHVCNYISEALGDNGRYIILSSAELEAVADSILPRRGQSLKSCDVLIYDTQTGNYLFVEIGIQRISRAALRGRPGEAANRVSRLEKKLEQVLNFRERLSIPSAFNIVRTHIPGEGPTEDNSGCLVVVMEYMHSPIFAQQRKDKHSKGPKRVYSSLYDFRYLLKDGADTGKGIPGLVKLWQDTETDRSLGRLVAEYGSGPFQ